MASTNDEFWTHEINNLLVDKRIANDALFRTSNSDQKGWSEILAELRKAGAPNSLNRVHVRRQWTKICEEYKKIVELTQGYEVNYDDLNISYYTKLKEFFEKNFSQTKHIPSASNNEDANKLLAATLLKENSFRQRYADRWPVSRINLLIDTRIAKNEFFERRGHAATAWQIVLAELIMCGEPKSLTVPQIRKKWDNLLTRYNELIKSRSSKLHEWPHFEKLHEFVTNKKTITDVEETKKVISPEESVDSEINDSIKIEEETNASLIVSLKNKFNIYSDRWSQERTFLLINRRIARNKYFKGRGYTENAWQIVLEDMLNSGEPNSLSIQQIKKKWENLQTKYSMLKKENSTKKLEWPYYEKLNSFYNNENIKSELLADFENTTSSVNQKRINSTDGLKWTRENTDTLINIRIENNELFKKRSLSGSAWMTVLTQFQKQTNTNVSIVQIKKKWDNLLTKYLIIKRSKLSRNPIWPYYKKLDIFFSNTDEKMTQNEIIINENNDYCNENKFESKVRMNNRLYADRWPNKRIKLLIERKIARHSMFDGRKLSTAGWRAVLSDMIAAGMPSTVTITQIKKKWENLYRKYKLISKNKKLQETWPFFKIMDNYLKNKQTLLNDDISDYEINNELIKEKLDKCRLCQHEMGEYLFIQDEDLCEKIKICLLIDVLDNSELLPVKICNTCKASLEMCYAFFIKCRDTNKELQENVLQSHVKIEPGSVINGTIKCDTSDDNNDSEIINDTNSITSYECSECPVEFHSNETLTTHLKSHKGNNTRYYCEMCNGSFSRQSALYAHIKNHFEMKDMMVVLPDKNETISSYDIEDNNSNNVDELLDEHEINNQDDTEDIHSNTIADSSINCIVCAKTFASRRTLREHLLQIHSPTILKCPREGCNKTYASLKSLQNHELKHLGIKSYLCVVCGKGFVTKNALQTHEKIHLDVKEHECKICCIRFAVISNLRAHQKKHHEGIRFYCSQCPKEFLSKDSLKRHEIAHTGIKDFICDICSAAFYTAKELRKHKFYHDGTRMHHCNLCFKTFFEKHHLTVHMRSHTDERPYPCQVFGCGKAFRESQKLRRHMKQQHKFHNT